MTVASSRMQVTSSSARSASRTGCIAPCRAVTCAQAWRLASFTAAVILRHRRSPLPATFFSSRHIGRHRRYRPEQLPAGRPSPGPRPRSGTPDPPAPCPGHSPPSGDGSAAHGASSQAGGLRPPVSLFRIRTCLTGRSPRWPVSQPGRLRASGEVQLTVIPHLNARVGCAPHPTTGSRCPQEVATGPGAVPEGQRRGSAADGTQVTDKVSRPQAQQGSVDGARAGAGQASTESVSASQ